MASAASLGLPEWPALALVLAPQPNRAQFLQNVSSMRQVATRPVGRGLRAMLRRSGRGAALEARSAHELVRVPLVQSDTWLEQARTAQAGRPRWQLRTPEVQCDACAASAHDAEAGEDSIRRDIPDINTFTTLQLGSATFKVTSLQPFSLLFKQHF